MKDKAQVLQRMRDNLRALDLLRATNWDAKIEAAIEAAINMKIAQKHEAVIEAIRSGLFNEAQLATIEATIADARGWVR